MSLQEMLYEQKLRNIGDGQIRSVPEGAILLEMPYSEVCMHMRVAGKLMWVSPVGKFMAQLYTTDGKKFSFPITRGEAGLR